MLVEVLAFEGCPHASEALELARRVAAEMRPAPEVRRIDVGRHESEAMRFLGSPSIRVDGRDIEPGSDDRREYAFGCRLHATSFGLRPLPDERWLREALLAAGAATSTSR